MTVVPLYRYIETTHSIIEPDWCHIEPAFCQYCVDYFYMLVCPGGEDVMDQILIYFYLFLVPGGSKLSSNCYHFFVLDEA